MFLENLRRCYNINLNDYENIGIDLEINKVLLPAFVVFGILMTVLAVYRKNTRDVVMQLKRHEALDEQSACTLGELGLEDNKVIRYILSHSETLKRIVLREGQINYGYEEYKKLTKEQRREAERIDFSEARFYISDSELDRARHIKEKYVVDKTRMIIGAVLLIMIYIALTAAMPEILNLVNNLLKRR